MILGENLLKEHTKLAFDYGSSVYGTLTEHSDKDVICIVDDSVDLSAYTNNIFEWLSPDNIDYQFINETDWIEIIKAHGIQWLECYSLPKEHIIKGSPDDYMQYFKLDKWTLRQVLSKISSNSWAKAEKKMTVEKDFDIYKGQKSLFHSFRILMFGIQIAKYGRITDYSEANWLWKEIYESEDCCWTSYENKYKQMRNKVHSEFVALCPKPINYFKIKKMENKKGFDINEKIVEAMTEYKNVCKQLTEMKKNGQDTTEVYNEQQKLKKKTEVYKLLKTAFMEYVTNTTNCEKLANRGVLSMHKEVNEELGKEYFVVDQEVSERIQLLPEDVQQQIIEKMISVRKKNVDIYMKNGRPEMASDEQGEIDVLNEFMPKEATKEEIEEWINEQWPGGIASSMIGHVIGEIKKHFSRVDGKLASSVVMSFVKK